MKDPLKYLRLLDGPEIVVRAIDNLALILQMRANLIRGFRILQSVPEHLSIARRDDDDRGHPRAGNQPRALHVPVVEGLACRVALEDVPREHETLNVAVGRQPDADDEEAAVVVELVLLDQQIHGEDVELLEQWIAHEDAAVGVLAEVIELDAALQVEGRAELDADLGILDEDVVADLEFQDALFVAPARLDLHCCLGAAVEPVAGDVHVRISR